MKRLFGTDGIRGPAGEFPLDGPTVYLIGRSLAMHLAENSQGRKPRILVGRDTRESGPWIEAAIVAGATEAGAVCESAGIITTPGVAYLARTLPADAGIVISASHNPYNDNGIKVFAPTGRKLPDKIERQIEKDIDAGIGKVRDIVFESVENPGAGELSEKYLNHLFSEVADGLNLEGLKIVLDCANGAASQLAPGLFERLGAEVVAINANPDGRNINAECGSLHLDRLQAKVIDENADLGVAFDGDADRALFVDARGEIVDGDATLWILAQYLASKGELDGQTVVATVMSNIGLEKALAGKGWKLLRTDVGDKNVLEELLRTNASIGGEQSGHIIFPKLSLAGDGMVTALCVLKAIKSAGIKLEESVGGFSRYPQILKNVIVRKKVPFADVPEIAAAVKNVEVDLAGNGRLLLRYSGTEPLARVMIEGSDQRTIEDLANELAGVIKASLG
ncbi:MAG: phosphoglucosamine mutase [Blastocatellia bacterium]|nr:phosphoglucosamine mutase [Blastocatellia bacterium]